MPIQFVCPECQRTLSVTRRKIGCQVTCPKCAASIAVPTGDPMVALAAQPAPRLAEPEQPSALDWIEFNDLPDFVPPGPIALSIRAVETSSLEALDEDEEPSDSRISLARGSIYGQALLILLIALVAFGVGYWLGEIDSRLAASPVETS